LIVVEESYTSGPDEGLDEGDGLEVELGVGDEVEVEDGEEDPVGDAVEGLALEGLAVVLDGDGLDSSGVGHTSSSGTPGGCVVRQVDG
jgi:hypothetical protein